MVSRGARNIGEVLCSVSNDKMELIPNTTVDVRILLRMHPNVLTVLGAAPWKSLDRTAMFI